MNTSIIICGKKYDIGTKVVLWDDGFNAYDTSSYTTKIQDRKTGKIIKSVVKGKRYSKRNLSLPELQKTITQFFLHHTGLYRAQDTFHVLHNQRRLSVHFILADDGTLYQTLDLKEKAWHGGKNNPMSIGVEIDSRATANRFPDAYDEYHQKKYNVGPRKKRLDLVQGNWIRGYEYNDKQYQTLINLGITLQQIFSINNKFPKQRGLIENPTKYNGIICHYNASITKIDPISFDHYRLTRGIENKNPLQPSTFIEVNSAQEKQELLKKLQYYAGKIDGDFGAESRAALKRFQKETGLKPDGLWGEKTTFMIDLVEKR